MATRNNSKAQSNGNGNGNGRKVRMQSNLKSTHSESVRDMIIQRFEQSPLRLNRRDAARVADKMVKIAEKSRQEVESLELP